MWDVSGISVAVDRLGSLEPREILYEFDGEPLTFTAVDPEGGLLLVHSLCVSDRTSRYLVAAIDARIAHSLKDCQSDILSALRQPRVWIADIADDASVKALWQVDFASVSAKVLPRHGAMIDPALDPIFRLRLIGPGVGPGKTTASDVRLAAQAAESGLRGLARIAFDEHKKVGRVSRTIRDYSDLPLQYTRAASFEIAFGRPVGRLPAVDDPVFDEMERLLKAGMDALRADGEDAAPIKGLNEEQATQLFEAIRALTPPSRGGIERVEIGGRLANSVAGSKILTRDDRLRSVERIKSSKKSSTLEPPFHVTGVAEGADQGQDFFVLRRLDPPEIPGLKQPGEIKFRFADHLFDKVSEAWNSQEPIAVVGERIGEEFWALDIRDAVGVASVAEGLALE